MIDAIVAMTGMFFLDALAVAVGMLAGGAILYLILRHRCFNPNCGCRYRRWR